MCVLLLCFCFWLVESIVGVEFAFYVNKSGQRTRNEFMVFWEGQPTGFGMDVSFLVFDVF